MSRGKISLKVEIVKNRGKSGRSQKWAAFFNAVKCKLKRFLMASAKMLDLLRRLKTRSEAPTRYK